ncbi:MAG: dephospho-CoA kinase [Gemmatimonadales bacterium]|nr:MAG: dephospho-CoA kinase [Gemmatimonadales bacterium]
MTPSSPSPGSRPVPSEEALLPSKEALQVGLTGNVASGKSTVARVWSHMGIPVVSADDLAREAVAPGTAGLEAVVELMGPEVRAADGGLDRAAVRRRVFRDPELRERLEAILHPRIAELRAAWVRDREGEGHRILVSEVPLLFEADLAHHFHRVVVVHTDAHLRRERLVRDRGLDQEEARRIMDAQGDPDAKRRAAHHVLVNHGSRGELEAAARALMERLQAEAGAGAGPGGEAAP